MVPVLAVLIGSNLTLLHHERRCTMAHVVRREVQVYASACERLLSDGWDPTLSQDEKDLIAYYAKEVNSKFKEPAYAGA